MACFIVPLVEAIGVSIYRKAAGKSISDPKSNLLKRNIPDLEKMLWGGSVLLVVDHVINGELTWRFPFFTALAQDGGGAVMLRELLNVGLPMAVVLTLVWAAYAAIKERRSAAASKA